MAGQRRPRKPKVEGIRLVGEAYELIDEPIWARGWRYVRLLDNYYGRRGRERFEVEGFKQGGADTPLNAAKGIAKVAGASIQAMIQACHPLALFKHADNANGAACQSPGKRAATLLDVTCPECRELIVRALTDDGRAAALLAGER